MAKKKANKKASGSEAWVAVLVQGGTYRGGMNGKAYKKGQTYTVSAKMAESLKASGQFILKLVGSKNKEEESEED